MKLSNNIWIRNLSPLDEDDENIPYDVDSLFTNIPVEEAIKYIIYIIYTMKKIPEICCKLVLKWLFLKLITKCFFQFLRELFKQTGCTTGGERHETSLKPTSKNICCYWDT